jgi:cyclophilin family peptidyl-prolyl cis-trans isomerase
MITMACAGCSGKDSGEGAPRKAGGEATRSASQRASATSSIAPARQVEAATSPTGNPVVVIQTNLGAIKAELWPDKAPQTVENFLRYANDEFFNGTIFHRVIPGFMVQGGGFMPDMNQKKTNAPIRNEARSDVKNMRGTLAMARTSDIHSATAQFFINVADNGFLDHKDDSARGFGYAVFGTVIDGMDVVDKIVNAPTTTVNGMENVPASTVTIESVTVQK